LTITRISTASWFKLKIGDKIIHFDPGYAGYFKNQRAPMDELEEKADIILISHFHKDHLQPEAIEKIIKAATVIIAPGGCEDRIKHKLTIVKPGESVCVGGIKIVAVDAYNTKEGHSTRKVHHKGDFVGYLVYFENKCIYFAGDTDVIEEMKNLGNVDIAFLPIGGTFVMDIEEAVKAVAIIKPVIVIPMHQSKNDPEIFRREVEAKSNSKAIILDVGDAL
jgi:L-ascorbate metabolism protein UlaG (beta-lactamase superfamily)